MRLSKAYRLYQTVLFIGIALLVLYEVFTRSAPKVMLGFVPVCIILAFGSYQIFRHR